MRPARVDVVTELNWLQRYAAEEVVEHTGAGRFDRREMMQRLVAICGTPALAAAFLASCASSSTSRSSSGSTTVGTTTGATTAGTTVTPATAPNASAPAGARAALSVAADDPAVHGAEVTFPGPAGTLFGYLARPSAEGRRAGVLVIHEIFGLTDHIRDVTRRVAKAGYVALAVDLASRAGGTAQAPNLSGALTQGPVSDRVADLDGGLAFLESQPDYNTALGVVGFCFGGGMTLSYAAAQPKVRAAVAYYGPTPQPASVMTATKAAILAQYGADDARVNAGIDALTSAMAGKTFDKRVYEGAGHAFNNDTGGGYVEARAVEAWAATLDWFGRYLA
jgi:carboxymethylenebutenolidase